MYKIIVLVCCFILAGSLMANVPAKKVPPNQRFDWKKAEGERRQMRKKILADYKKYIESIREFHKRYAAAESDAEKNKIRVELSEFLTKEVNRKVEHSKKRIEETKKFVAKLEEEQKKMEANAPEFVKKRTEEILQGKIVPDRRRNARK